MADDGYARAANANYRYCGLQWRDLHVVVVVSNERERQEVQEGRITAPNEM